MLKEYYIEVINLETKENYFLDENFGLYDLVEIKNGNFDTTFLTDRIVDAWWENIDLDNPSDNKTIIRIKYLRDFLNNAIEGYEFKIVTKKWKEVFK